ncbi:MAG: nucleoside-diphosphate kinase [Spirochaetaceae bacterium]|nr:MAG: nucleoside-diphosphate kinase [Spirochaetaceae bacterium]
MANEKTYAMLKPGVLERKIVGEIISRFEKKGLRIAALKLRKIPRELCEQHYAEHKDKAFFGELVNYVTGGPVVTMVIAGEDAIATVRKICGATKPADAAPGTIRGDYGAVVTKNVIHASDSTESAAREIKLFFEAEEIIDYPTGDDTYLV